MVGLSLVAETLVWSLNRSGNMETMEREEFDALATLLRGRAGALRAFIGAGRRSSEAHHRRHVGAVHSLSQESFAELTATLSRMNLAMASEELREVDAALNRMALGCYGVCSDCGGRIGYARLRVTPEARRCGPCQSRAAVRSRAGVPAPRL